MSRTLEKILQEVQALDPEERRQLRDFLEHEIGPPPSRPDPDLILRIQGKYAHVKTSSDSFIARKAAEIELEDHGLRS